MNRMLFVLLAAGSLMIEACITGTGSRDAASPGVSGQGAPRQGARVSDWPRPSLRIPSQPGEAPAAAPLLPLPPAPPPEPFELSLRRPELPAGTDQVGTIRLQPPFAVARAVPRAVISPRNLRGSPTPARRPAPGGRVAAAPTAIGRPSIQERAAAPAQEKAPGQQGRRKTAPREEAPRQTAPAASAAGSSGQAAPPAGRAVRASPAKTAAPAAQRSSTEGALETRQLFARRGDRVELRLEEPGWILREIQGSPASGLALSKKPESGTGSVFVFQARELGEYRLLFQLQDNRSAALREQAVSVRVLPEQEFVKMVGASGGASTQEGQKPAAVGGALERAERLLALGDREAALAEFLQAYREDDPYLNDRIASIYVQTGKPQAAARYYRKNLGAQEPYADRAVAGVIRAGVEDGDAAAVAEQLDRFLALEPTGLDRDLLAVALFYRDRGLPARALELLREYLARYPASPRLDEAVFALAGLLEADTPQRDLQRSRDLYERLVRDYPESRRAPEAYQRLRYLDRHFFLIR